MSNAAAKKQDVEQQTAPDLSVQIGKTRLPRPVLLASGTCGYGVEYSDLLDFTRIGGLFTKSVTLEPRKGNAPPRTVETSAGMLNAIGLANVGLDAFCRDKIPEIRDLLQAVREKGNTDFRVFANVAGHSVDEYVKVCRRLDEQAELSGIELNVSCPNVSDGLTFGTNPALLGQLVAAGPPQRATRPADREALPQRDRYLATAKAAVDAGADALSLVNTFVGMAINIDLDRPILSNCTGGLSGPAIKPLAVYAVYKVYKQVAQPAGIPLFGMGGIVSWRDAAEFVLAGASAVVVGTATFLDPTIPAAVADGLGKWLKAKGCQRISELTGTAAGDQAPCPNAAPQTQ